MNYQFRKRPTIEAFQMTLARRWDNQDWPSWLNEAWNREPGDKALFIDGDDPKREKLLIDTHVGALPVPWDHWIIRGVMAENDFYLCDPGTFSHDYEPAV